MWLVVAISRDVVEALRAKFEAVLPHLDERQQRLVMAGEARSLGHGGIAAVAGATGVSRSRYRREWPSWRPASLRWAGQGGSVVAASR
jgi:hypothetical protein